MTGAVPPAGATERRSPDRLESREHRGPGGQPVWAPEFRRGELIGREPELRALEGLLDAVRSGQSQALVLQGGPGMGKTALLNCVGERATDFWVVGAAGVEAEMELSFAALHQLCAPLLDRLDDIPAPQALALKVTFGIAEGPPPDRLLASLAALSLISETASERPLLVLVDDAQWIDAASAQMIAFVARRLGAESVGMVIGTRKAGPELDGLPRLDLKGLSDEESRRLLAAALTGPLDARVVDRLVAEAHGNPLALLELPQRAPGAELAGGFASPGSWAQSDSIEASFRLRAEMLPEATQKLLLVAAADPIGDPVLVWRAAERLGVDPGAAQPAVDEGLVTFGTRVHFRHPLVRSAVYGSASAGDRREAHAVLAEVTDPVIDPERRAWHSAAAAGGPDEDVAAELVRYADRAQSRGGWAAAAAFLERATELSSGAPERAARALAAGQAKVQAGAFERALELLAVAEAGPLEEADRAHLDLVRAQLAFATNRGSAAPSLLLKAAQRLKSIDPELARVTYLDAFVASFMAGPLAGPGANVAAVATAAASAPPVEVPGASDLLLDGLAAAFHQGYAAGLPTLRAALYADLTGMPVDRELRWLSLAYRSAMLIWDDERAVTLCARAVQLARETGSLSELALAINDQALLLLLSGDPSGAASAVAEAFATADALGTGIAPYGPVGVAAWRGAEAEASTLIEESRKNAEMRGEGGGLAGAAWARAVLNNGLGRHAEALAAAQQASTAPDACVVGLSNWVLVEQIEAAARSGANEVAAEATRRLSEMARASGSDWALGCEARARALIGSDGDAEKLFREAVDHLRVTSMRPELARTHLLLGEWLRRQGRRTDARAELYTALEMLEAMGLSAFAERARRELQATGETTRKRQADTRNNLTPQEVQVAKLAREGLSNPEIAARLYISARTVQYHLSKVFTKLGITSRNQLDRVLE